MTPGYRIAFFGSSLVSSYWNGAATYYRGIIRALNQSGIHVTFFEPEAYERQKHRDIPDPPWATVRIFRAEPQAMMRALEEAQSANLIVKASGMGIFDEDLEQLIPEIRRPGSQVAFWDVDAPATLDRIASNPVDPFRAVIPRYDVIFTYGGGESVVHAYRQAGAQRCIPIYNALDETTHRPVPPDPRFEGDLAFLGNRLPDREERVENFFFKAAEKLSEKKFLLGGNGWDTRTVPPNVKRLGHVYTSDHNAFNCTPRAVLNINRESMARYGFSPATRIFEAAGAGACIITDAWKGIDHFLEPNEEILVAKDGEEVAMYLEGLSAADAARIGCKARARILAHHTYSRRALQVIEALDELPNRSSLETAPA